MGPLPAATPLPPAHRVSTGDVPLQQLPPWIGVDRALAAWEAWRRTLEREVADPGAGPVPSPARSLLVADAGSALSLTRVQGEGHFAGGLIQAGLRMQLRALGHGTAGLPLVQGPAAEEPLAAHEWPVRTADAMLQGVLRGLAGAVQAAHQRARRQDSTCRLWLTGGDAAWIAPLLGGPDGAVPGWLIRADHLVMEGLIRLRPCCGLRG
ncbi:type III pantothenate kinase [Synechococcus sp. RSCCF101]|uniref:type III pantothenate kinase n=1 Tax=Synechococcus sp. RSCCF101 TaxID=2511069 RepID=UPI001780DF87|nr:type III pantothenate kinase [Synechococcus sp. RSCCF101]